MSPKQTRPGLPSARFPRVSGDEPYQIDWVQFAAAFSPRERG